MVRILCTTSRKSKACAKKMLLLFIAFDILTLKSPPLKTSPSQGFLLFIVSTTLHRNYQLEILSTNFKAHLKILLIQQSKRPNGPIPPGPVTKTRYQEFKTCHKNSNNYDSFKTEGIYIIHIKLLFMSDTTKEIMLYYGPYKITPTLLYYA